MNKQKKKLAARVYDALFPPKKGQKRSYQAARLNRQNANWATAPTGANYERRLSLAALRARAREASRDNGHIVKFLSLTRSNIVGQKGIQLKCGARSLDGKSLNVTLNKHVEEQWWQWGHRETCTMSGKLDWVGVQRLIVTQLACDGEFLVELVEGVNDFGLSLKVWDVNWLDETYNDTLPGGNRVIMSVEVDANDRPVAYWLTTPPSEMNFTNRRVRTRTRVPAERMIHGFLVFDDESQVRGVTWFHAALLTIKNHQGYTEGVIQSARMQSNVVGFIEETTPDGEEYTGGEDDEGNAITPTIDVSPLSINKLPPGQNFKLMDPNQPTQNHAAFAKTVLMDVAAALGVPYFYLAGDLEAVNFSSARVGLDDARDIWKCLQEFVANMLCRQVYHSWTRQALLAGKLKVTAKEYLEIQNPTWQGRGWKYIDPTKDVAASVEKLRYRLSTPSTELADQGIDYIDFLERWKADRELANQYGIDIEGIYAEKTAQPAAGAPADGGTDEPPPPDKPKRYLNGHDEEGLPC